MNSHRAGASSPPRRSPTVDFHCHIIVPEVVEFLQESGVIPGESPRTFVSKSSADFQNRQSEANREKSTSPAARLADMDAMGVDIQVLTVNLSHYCYWAEAAKGKQIAEICNDRIAEFVAAAPDRFVAMATVPLQDTSLAVAELKRATAQLGLKGVVVSSRVEGKELGDPSLTAFWEAVRDLDIPVFVHPAGYSHPDRLQSYFMWNSFGQPLEEAHAMASLIYEGVINRIPGLKICFAHGGGFLPFYAGRVDRAFEVRPESRINIDRRPSEYMREFYYDTVVYNIAMLEFLAAKVGNDRLVMGTDYPAFLGEQDPIGFVSKAGSIGEAMKRGIMGENALKLLGLAPSNAVKPLIGTRSP